MERYVIQIILSLLNWTAVLEVPIPMYLRVFNFCLHGTVSNSNMETRSKKQTSIPADKYMLKVCNKDTRFMQVLRLSS